MSQPNKAAALPAVFRPPAPVRLLLAVFGVACGGAALWVTVLCILVGDPGRIAAAAVLLIPAGLALAVHRKRVIVTEDALESTTLLGLRRVPWDSVRRLDQRRSGFVVETQSGPVSAGWLTPRERDRLMRLVLEKARLTISRDRVPWGIGARYVPRAQPIAFGAVPRTPSKPQDP